jgi:hypothetical protein
MKGTKMKDMAVDAAGNWLGLLFAGLGVTFAPHEWIGGMFLALSAAAFAMRRTDQAETLIKVLVGAFIASHVGAIVVHYYMPALPVQIVMAGIGFFSQPLMRMAFGFGIKVESKTDVISEKLIDKVLPTEKKE